MQDLFARTNRHTHAKKRKPSPEKETPKSKSSDLTLSPLAKNLHCTDGAHPATAIRRPVAKKEQVQSRGYLCRPSLSGEKRPTAYKADARNSAALSTIHRGRKKEEKKKGRKGGEGDSRLWSNLCHCSHRTKRASRTHRKQTRTSP
jgi:hypothetical protein